MSKNWMVPGLAMLALVIAGCGGSSNHTSEWNKAQVASAETEISISAPSLSSAGRACYLKGVEADFSPSVRGQSSANGADKEKLLKILAGCGYKPESTSTSSSSGGETYGPACKQQLESAACAEEQEKKAGAAIQQGEVNRDKEEKEENKEVEEEKARQENPTG